MGIFVRIWTRTVRPLSGLGWLAPESHGSLGEDLAPPALDGSKAIVASQFKEAAGLSLAAEDQEFSLAARIVALPIANPIHYKVAVLLPEVSILVRVKSEAVREAILSAATTEFSERGYLKATVNSIARGARTAPSNVYVYFASKLEIVLAIYEPWFKEQILNLEKAVAKKRTPEEKILRLVSGLLRDIADDENGYTSTLIAALATATPPDGYKPDLLLWAEEKIGGMIQEATMGSDMSGRRLHSLARLLMLLFDGVAVRSNLKQNIGTTTAMLNVISDVISSDFLSK